MFSAAFSKRRFNLEKAVFCVIAAALLVDLGQTRFARMNDESLYAQIALEMRRTGNRILPTWFGHEALYKPPLLYWLILPCFKIFGENLLAARIPSVLAALLTLLVSYLLVKRQENRRAAALAVLFLGTSLSFVRYARAAMMEPLLMLFFTLNMYALYKAHQNDKGPWSFWWFAALGASCLVKGPVSAVILILAAFFFSALTRRWDWMFRKPALPGIFAALALVLLWPALAAWHGQFGLWWKSFILRENFGKFHEAFHYSPNNLWKRFLVHLIPWPFFFLASVWIAFREGQWKKPEILLHLSFLAAFFGVFALPEARLYHYTVPALPSAAMLLAEVYAQNSGKRAFRAASLTTGALLILAGLVLALSPVFFNLHGLWPLVLEMALFLTAAGAVLGYGGKMIYAAGAVALVYFSAALLAGLWMFPVFPAACKPLLGDAPVGVIHQSAYLWSYETGRHVSPLENGLDSAAFLNRGGKVATAQAVLQSYANGGLPPKSYRILCRWPALRSNFGFRDFMKGLQSGDKSMLEDRMLLIESR